MSARQEAGVREKAIYRRRAGDRVCRSEAVMEGTELDIVIVKKASLQDGPPFLRGTRFLFLGVDRMLQKIQGAGSGILLLVN